MIKSTEEIMNKRLVKTVFSKQEKKLQNNAEQIVEALKKLYTESERAVPEYGDFRVVKTILQYPSILPFLAKKDQKKEN